MPPSCPALPAGETRDRPDLVYLDAQGQVQSSKPVGAALVQRPAEGVAPGRRMRLASGRHEGLACEVVSLEPRREGRSDRARVRLLPSQEVVTVRAKELAELGSGKAQRAQQQQRAEQPESSHAAGRAAERGERA